jgi:Flp pilus assembly protein TadD
MTDEISMSPAPQGPVPEVGEILDRALEFGDEENWDGMAEELREGLTRFPGDPYLLCWLGIAERELGLEGVAAERFRQALEQEPRDPVLLATAGNALASFDDPAAEGALRTAALLAPDLVQARWMYGAWLAREGMFEEALAELEVAYALAPDDGVVLTERGTALALADRLDEAVVFFGEAVALDSEDSWARMLLGLAHLESGDLESALPELLEGARQREEEAEAQLLAALALVASGAEDSGWEMLERARLLVDQELADLVEILEVEEQLEAGAERAERFLREDFAPLAFRQRLMQRP